MRIAASMIPGLISVALIFNLGSCSPHLSLTRKAVQSTVKAVDQTFTRVRKEEDALTAKIAGVYAQTASLDLSTHGLDEEQGGLFATYPGYKYYYKKEPKGAAFYVSPLKPITEPLRKQVKFLGYVDPLVAEAETRVADVVAVVFYGVKDPVTIALLSPWFDVVSLLPPGLDLEMFEWYQRGEASPGPAVWSKKPFTDLVTGWVMDVSEPVRTGGQVKGVSVISVNLLKLAAQTLKDTKEALVLMGPDSTVVGLTASAEDLLKIHGLETYDYLKQTKENTFVPGKYQLTDPGQPPEIRALAKALGTGKPEFQATLGGKSFTVVRQTVPENGMVVFGISE